MTPTPAQLAAGLAASYALRDRGDPAAGTKPVSFTGDPRAHVLAIATAILADLPEPHPRRLGG